MNTKNKIIAIILFVTAVAVGAYFFRANNNLSHQFKKNGIHLSEIEGFKLKELTENKIFAERDGEILKIEIIKNINESKAEEYVKNQTALLKGMFESQLPPYPEFLTKESGCAEKYKPKEYQGKYGKYFILYAGNRLGYGVCVDDLIEYRASLGYFYCQDKDTLFKIEYFSDLNKDLNAIVNFNNSFVCK